MLPLAKFANLSKQAIVKIYGQIVEEKQLVQLLLKENHHFQISNLVGSSLSFVISESFKKVEKPFLLIFHLIKLSKIRAHLLFIVIFIDKLSE